MKKKKIKIAIDTAMTILMPILMAYALVGEAIHEWLGIAMFILFMAHHILNRYWIMNITKGKYNIVRSVNLLVNLVLLIIMFVLPISGIIMSKHVFAFLNLHLSVSLARTIHLIASYWGFVLMSIHIGLHWNNMLGAMGRRNDKKNSKTAIQIALNIVMIAIMAFGGHAFYVRRLGTYMFLKNQFVFFDYTEPPGSFFVDYIAIMILCAGIGYYLSVALRNLQNKRKTIRK